MKGPNGFNINPLNDFVFMKALGEQGAEQQLLALINAVLEEAKQPLLKQIGIIPKHISAGDTEDDKSCIFDVEATADNGQKVNVEVQIANNGNIRLRLLFYWAKLFTEDFEKGDDYSTLPKVIVIAILDHNLKQTTHFFNHWQLKNQYNQIFSDAINIFTIEMKKFGKLQPNLNSKLQQWLTFLHKKTKQNLTNTLIDMNTDIKQTYDRIQHAMQQPDAYKAYVRKKIAQMDYNSGLRNAEEKGLKKGVGKGRKLGKKLGIQQGIQQGVEKGKMEMILELHNIGLSVETIAQAAKRSVNEVIAVVNKHKKKENVFAV